MSTPNLSLMAAPMINQSDLPFRMLVRKYGATCTYTQMLHPYKLLNDQEYLEFHLRDLQACAAIETGRPVVVQLCGNDPELIVKGARKMVEYCDGIDLNLGCPQKHAKEGHYGAYLLSPKDLPVVQSIVSSLSNALPVPTSTKIRLTQPASLTLPLALTLQNSGTSWITLHARHVSSRNRRRGLADLSQVKALKACEHMKIPIVSNGNVRGLHIRDGGDEGDVVRNLSETGADGIMVGEGLLGNPCLFANKIPDPVLISLEYLLLCREYPRMVTLPNVQTHIRHFFDIQCARQPWYGKFRTALGNSKSLDQIEDLLRKKVQRWRGLKPMKIDDDRDGDGDTEAEEIDDLESEEDSAGLHSTLHGLSLLP